MGNSWSSPPSKSKVTSSSNIQNEENETKTLGKIFNFPFYISTYAYHFTIVEAIVLTRQLFTIPGSFLQALKSYSPLLFIKSQYHIFCVLQLESAHLFQDRLEKHNYGKLGLPHVDNLNSSKTKKMKPVMNPMIITDLVLVGGGHANVYVIKKFGMNPIQGVRVTLITNDVITPYSGMLPGYIAGHYTHEECHIDLHKLCRFAKINLIQAEVTNIDRKNKRIYLKDRPSVHYDVMSINIGSSPRPLPNFEGVAVVPVKPISTFSQRWITLLESVTTSSGMEKMKIVIVGGGAGGTELALSIQRRLKTELKKLNQDENVIHMTILTRSKTLFPSHNKETQATFARICEERGIDVGFECEVIGTENCQIVCKNGRKFDCDHCVWCVDAGAQSWLTETGMALNENGFINVNEYLESENSPGIFCAGDIAHLTKNPRPKAGVFAVRAGPYLEGNIRSTILNQPMNPFIPQSSFLGIIGTGMTSNAVASKGEMALEGPWLWDLKDWIDKTWMAGYSTDLPEMVMETEVPEIVLSRGGSALQEFSEAQMRCGGCGAKIGATVLSNVMKRLKPDLLRSDLCVVGLDEPDDCAVMRCPPNENNDTGIVSTVDFFRSFVNDPYTFGQISAVHSLSDCHAIGGQAVTALAVAVVPYGAEKQVEECLYAMMAGAVSKLNEAGCALVGGHSCEGVELALGFSINGTVSISTMMRKGPMKVGDKILITKAIGTGALFAADMRGKAKGKWIVGALERMVKMNEKAGKCLNKFKASSCTDVTGFGVGGHLNEMLIASPNTRARINLDDVPVLDGAIACVKAGILSSLQPQNARTRRIVSNDKESLKHDTYPLIFDPQTSGGLLATVAADVADECVQELQDLGYLDTAIIGEILEYDGQSNIPEENDEVCSFKLPQRISCLF